MSKVALVCLLGIFIILEVATNSYCSESVELDQAIQSAITYYNNSVNLADRLEMVEKFYELERDDGVFLPARLRMAPTVMQKVSDDLETLEYEAKHKNRGDKKIIRKIKDIEEELAANYGSRTQTFRILRHDPMVLNMRAVERMNKHWEGLMEEFRTYTQSQRTFLDGQKFLRTVGISLSPSENDNLFLLMQDEDVKGIFEKYPKSADFIEDATFSDIIEKLNLKNKDTPKQTSQEIKALQSVLNGEDIDPITKQMLQGFIPELNKKCMLIIGKLKSLENTIQVIEEESQNYANYVIDKREELHDALLELGKQFDPDSIKDEL